MKKFLSLVAVVALCFSLCVPAFADEAAPATGVPSTPAFCSEMKTVISEYNPQMLVSYNVNEDRFTVLLFKDFPDLIYDIDARRIIVKPGGSSVVLQHWSYSDGRWQAVTSSVSSDPWGTVLAGNPVLMPNTTSWSRYQGEVLIPESSTFTIYNEDGSVFFSRLLHLWRNNFRHRRGS